MTWLTFHDGERRRIIEVGDLPLFVISLFAESFAAPVAARVAAPLGRKIALLVLCNPLVDAPIFPPLATLLLRSGAVPVWAVAHEMTGGDRELAAAVLREVRELPKEVLASPPPARRTRTTSEAS